MGRKSIKKDKSIYQKRREELGLSREQASELSEGLSAPQIEKIENGRVQIHPGDVQLLAQAYKDPSLCNHFCVNECPLGNDRNLPVESKELGQIAIETFTALNALNREKDRLMEIAEDGEVTPDEYEDFKKIQANLERIQMSVNSMKLWVDEKIAQEEAYFGK